MEGGEREKKRRKDERKRGINERDNRERNEVIFEVSILVIGHHRWQPIFVFALAAHCHDKTSQGITFFTPERGLLAVLYNAPARPKNLEAC